MSKDRRKIKNLSLSDDSVIGGQAHGITGALICRDDLVLQLLEGPTDAAEAACRRIAMSNCAVCRAHGSRQQPPFPRWSMKDGPARSWIRSRAEVDAGVPDRAAEAVIVALPERLAGTPA